MMFVTNTYKYERCLTCQYHRSGSSVCEDCNGYEIKFQPSRVPNSIKKMKDYIDRNNFLCVQKLIFNPPATIVYWGDGSKTVVKCREDETFDTEKGFAMAICKHVIGDHYYNQMKETIETFYPSFDYEIPEISEDISDSVSLMSKNLEEWVKSLKQDISDQFGIKPEVLFGGD